MSKEIYDRVLNSYIEMGKKIVNKANKNHATVKTTTKRENANIKTTGRSFNAIVK